MKPVACEVQVFPPLTPADICGTATILCNGDLYPYDSYDECLEFMQQLPVRCGSGEGTYTLIT